MLFDAWNLRGVVAPNRIVRSATYEGLADESGRPRRELGDLYAALADGGAGTIITGFAFVSVAGRAMQMRQCGIDADDKAKPWADVVKAARSANSRPLLLMQLAHTGLQTIPRVTGRPAIAPSVRQSPYFRTKPRAMTEADIAEVIAQFTAAAVRAKTAGFDGIQLHAAHGYLLHQFLSPFTNRRRDRWGRDRAALLREIACGIGEACGDDFAVFVKLSVPDGHPGGVDLAMAVDYVKEMESMGVRAVEISYGTMDVAFNIFRGGAPIDLALKHNILFNRKPAWLLKLWKILALPALRRQLIPFTEGYNLASARAVKQATNMPVIVVGGVRDAAMMREIVQSGDADAVAMCRPLICEPDLPERLKSGRVGGSACTNCNVCAVMCDSAEPVRCYRKG